jgi:peptide/nickel transport system substrate-binding protein
VKFSLERVATDASLREYGNYRQIRDVEVVNAARDHHPHARSPNPVLLNRISRIGSSIVPQHHVEAVGWDGFNRDPIGTGPFRFVEWRRDDRVILEAFDDHWRGRPAGTGWCTAPSRRTATRVAELLTGGVHIATNIPTQDARACEASGTAAVEPWPTPRVMLFLMNTSDEQSPPATRACARRSTTPSTTSSSSTRSWAASAPRAAAASAPASRPRPCASTTPTSTTPSAPWSCSQEAGYAPGELTIRVRAPRGATRSTPTSSRSRR